MRSRPNPASVLRLPSVSSFGALDFRVVRLVRHPDSVEVEQRLDPAGEVVDVWVALTPQRAAIGDAVLDVQNEAAVLLGQDLREHSLLHSRPDGHGRDSIDGGRHCSVAGRRVPATVTT